jgi:uncharacterized protein (DUF1015 family)
MANIQPFKALRPKPEVAKQICELPYDVFSKEEARRAASGNPLSFLHVSKPEIDLPDSINPYGPEVYQQGKSAFAQLISTGHLVQDASPCYYLYRQTMGNHSQLGLVAVASCRDYAQNIIKKHELTRPDKENDRVNHIAVLEAQTGPAFLAYKAHPELDSFLSQKSAEPPTIDFAAPDGIRHSSWMIHEPELIQRITNTFAAMDSLYIADGHHRTAAALRVAHQRNFAGSAGFFLAVIFPHNQLRILPYNRVIKDLNGLSPREFLGKLETVFEVKTGPSTPPDSKHMIRLYLEQQWYSLTFRPEIFQGRDLIRQLDVTLLQENVLAPWLDITDPRTSKRIDFVGGIRGTPELERLVNQGSFACAFALYPTSIEDLMAIADQGGIMPPKSTWFEPKLRDGMFCHRLES